MYKLILFLGIGPAFALGSELKIPSKGSEKMLGCYLTRGVPYNKPQPDFKTIGIDASLCTHFLYNLAGIDSNGSVVNLAPDSDPTSDADIIKYQYSKDQWKKNHRIKLLAHVAALDDIFSNDPLFVLADPDLRETVVNNVVKFAKKYLFDGVDIDLTNAPKIPVHSTYKKNLVLFLKALKEKFDEEGLILSASVDPKENTAYILYDIKGISTYLNFIILMAFDFSETLDQQMKLGVGHYSPLYHSSKENAKQRKKNIDYVVTYWIREGAPANKLILGTDFSSGLSYTLANTNQIARGAPFTTEGKYSFSKYSQTCVWSRQPEWKYFFDKEQQVPYLYNGDQILPYDDVASITAKAEYVNRMKLGGAVALYLHDDDFGGKCGERFALLKALNRVLRKKS